MRGARLAELLVIVVAAAGVALLLWASRALPARAQLFPLVIGVGMLALLAVQAVVSLRSDVGVRKVMDARFGAGAEPRELVRRSLTTLAWLVGLFVAIVLFGFRVGGLAYLFLYVRIGYREGWLATLFVVGAAALLLYIVGDVLHIRLARGIVFGA